MARRSDHWLDRALIEMSYAGLPASMGKPCADLAKRCVLVDGKSSANWPPASRGLTGLFKSGEHRGQVRAENIREISALLHEHGRQAHPRDRRADAAEPGGGDRKALERIVLGGIEAERDHERAGRKGTDGLSPRRPSLRYSRRPRCRSAREY